MDTQPELRRYAGKLLFQFRVMVDGKPPTRYRCEERTFIFRATDSHAALFAAKARGRGLERSYRNTDRNSVHYEFVGVIELLWLDPACAEDEVWYERMDRVRPMERRATLLRPESELEAICCLGQDA